MFENKRKIELTLSRHLVTYYCRMLLGYSYCDCQTVFGRKSHASCLLSCRIINNLRKNNSRFSPLIQMLDDRLFIEHIRKGSGYILTHIHKSKIKHLYYGIHVKLIGQLALSFEKNLKMWNTEYRTFNHEKQILFIRSGNSFKRDENGRFVRTKKEAIRRVQPTV